MRVPKPAFAASFVALVIALCVLLCPPIASPQAATTSLRGIVTDSSGAAVPRAKVVSPRQSALSIDPQRQEQPANTNFSNYRQAHIS